MKPVLYFISILRKNYPANDGYFLTRECRQFFDLLANLVGEYLSQVQNSGVEAEAVFAHSEIDPLEILNELV